MENKRIRDIEGYETFKAECSFFKCEEEYPGWTGNEKYGIITGLSKDELEAKYPQFIKVMSPYVLLDLEYGEIRAEAKRNDHKHEMRSKRTISGFEMDEEAEAMHHELSIPDYQTAIEEKEMERKHRLQMTALCRKGLSELTEIQKQTLVLKYIKKKTLKEIAALQGKSYSTVRESLESGKKKFEKVFENTRYFGTPLCMHYEGVSSILKRITASTKIENDEN